MDLGIIIATFGDSSWIERAQVAKRSAEDEQPGDLIVYHGAGTLAEARNTAAGMTSAEWLCFLDADDELEPGYVEAMTDAERFGGLLAPAVRWVEDGKPAPSARTLADRHIDRLNPCVIGTLIRRERFEEIGGFWEERAWEDWSLFRRAHLAGDEIHHVPRAVYRANVRPSSRNNVPQPRQLHRQILASHRQWERTRA